MRTCIIVNVSPFKIAIADLTQVGERTYEINRLNVPELYRGKGHGRKLLKQVLDEADRCGVTLRCYSMSSGPLTNSALDAWYKRNGFSRYPDDYLYRLPKM
jgi:GNAT superfamily N-acetyltransferase